MKTSFVAIAQGKGSVPPAQIGTTTNNQEHALMLNRFRKAFLAASALAVTLTVHSAVCAEEAAIEEKSFTVVLLPDTQFYSEKYPDAYVAQTLWIRQRRKDDNIKFVIHLGDIVQTSTQKPEWENANRAMQLLDGVVPYSMVPGSTLR